MATIDELKKKDGSAVNAGAVRPTVAIPADYTPPKVNVNTGVYDKAPAATPTPPIQGGALPTQATPTAPTSGVSGRMAQGFKDLTGVGSVPSGALGKVTGALGSVAGGAIRTAGKLAAPVAIGVEGLDVAKVAMDQNSTGIDVASQVAQGAGRLGAAGAGAAAGAAIGSVIPVVGTAIGGVAGGLAGYYGADKVIEYGRNLLGSDPRAPAAMVQAPVAPTTSAAAQTPPPVAPVAQAQATPAAALPAQQPQAPMAAGALPQPGQVTRVGNSYSGANVSGDISINGQGPRGGVISAQDNQAAENLARRGGQTSGFGPAGAIRGGGQVSSIDTSAGYASDLRQLAEIEKNKAAQEVSMQGQADYAAMRAGRMSKKDYQALQAGNKADATTRRGQDIQAGATRDSSRLAQERLKLDAGKAGQDATNANLDNESKTMLLSAQKAFLSAKTPEEQQSALAVLTGLSGKAQPAPVRAFAVPGGQATDANGTPYTMASSVYDPDTKQFIQQNGQQGGGQKAAPPSTAVQMLKDNPTMAAQFDAKYGPGASKQYLAQK